MADFVCMGDATIDNFFFIDDASVHCNLLKENCMLELKYGQKISVSKFGTSLGGNAANVSVCLSRLGISSGLSTIFGDDERGAWIKRQLLTENVDLTSAITASQRESNISSIIIFQGERTILSYHSDQIETLALDQNAKWIYLTSSPGTDSTQLFKMLEALNPLPKLAFNPSVPDLKKGSAFLKPIIEKTEVLILNKEEYAMLGMRGPKITVVTDGKNGVTAYIGDQTIKKPAIGEKAYEPTGAGDAFSSGFLAGLYYGMKPEDALDWGLKNAASVIQKIGAIEGLLTKDVILEAEGR